MIVFLLGVLGRGLSFPSLADDRSAGQSLSTPPFFKTSFDCSKARVLSTEEAICKNDDLAKLDIEMAEAYTKRLESAAAPEKTLLVQSQKKWLIIRDSYNVNPYRGDFTGALSDLGDVYRNRIAALKSGKVALLDTKLPREYHWLRSIAAEDFSEGFRIGRAYVSCEDPCKRKPELYKWISIGGRGIGEEPGDVDTPYAKLAKKLTAEGWTKCRSADDSGKPTLDYFRKNGKMVSVSRYYSMGVGNGISFGITISGPLPQNDSPPPLDPALSAISSWDTYASSDVGLELRYPPKWHVRDASVPGSGTKYLMFNADDFKPGEFRITLQPAQRMNHHTNNPNNDDPGPKCTPSRYRISGLPAQQCLLEFESVGDDTCTRYIQSVEVITDRYGLSLELPWEGSFDEGSNGYRLTDFYERVMSTIKIK